MLEERKEISADSTQNPAKRRCTVIENDTENYNIKNLKKSFEQHKDRVIRLLSNAIREHENILFNLKLHIEYELLLDRDLYELKELIHQSGMKKLYNNNDISKIYREQCRVIAKNIQRFVEHNDGAKRRHVKHLTVDIYKYIGRKQTSKDAAENAEEENYENVSQTSSTNTLSNQNFTSESKGIQSSTANIHIPIFDLTEDDLQFPPSRMTVISKEVCANNSLPSTSPNFTLETLEDKEIISTSKGSQSSLQTFHLTEDYLKFPSSIEETTTKEIGANSTSTNFALETFDDIEIEMDENIKISLPKVPRTAIPANTTKEDCTQLSSSEDIPMKTSNTTETISKDYTQHSSTNVESSQKLVFPGKISQSPNFGLETHRHRITSTSKGLQSFSPTFDLTEDHLKIPSSKEERTTKEVGANNTSANFALVTFDDIKIEMDEDIQISLPKVPQTAIPANTTKEDYTQSSSSEDIPMKTSNTTETISKNYTQHSSTNVESSQKLVFPEKISQSFTTAKQPLQISDNTENIYVNTLQSFSTKTPASIPKNKNTNSKTFPALPIDILRKKACIGILNNDIYNFKWTIISALQKVNQNPQRCSQYNIVNISSDIIRLENDIIVNFQGLNFPYTTLNDVKQFQLQNPQISVNVFGVENDNKTVGLYSICDVEKPKHINLLLLRENEKTHYFWIRNLSRLLARQLTKNTNKLFICNLCVLHFQKESTFIKHLENDCKTKQPLRRKHNLNYI